MLAALPALLSASVLRGAVPALLLFELNLADWAFILLANIIVFGILGKKLAADVRGWMAALGVAGTGQPVSAPTGPLSSAQPREQKGRQHEE